MKRLVVRLLILPTCLGMGIIGTGVLAASDAASTPPVAGGVEVVIDTSSLCAAAGGVDNVMQTTKPTATRSGESHWLPSHTAAFRHHPEVQFGVNLPNDPADASAQLDPMTVQEEAITRQRAKDESTLAVSA